MGHGGPAIATGATTSNEHWNVAGSDPELSVTVAEIGKLPGVVGVPEMLMLDPDIADAENAPMTVHEYIPEPPVTARGMLNAVPTRTDEVGQEPVIWRATLTVRPHLR
jgi:hypothetical protein